jgi:hypothetical protein
VQYSKQHPNNLALTSLRNARHPLNQSSPDLVRLNLVEQSSRESEEGELNDSCDSNDLHYIIGSARSIPDEIRVEYPLVTPNDTEPVSEIGENFVGEFAEGERRAGSGIRERAASASRRQNPEQVGAH